MGYMENALKMTRKDSGVDTIIVKSFYDKIDTEYPYLIPATLIFFKHRRQSKTLPLPLLYFLSYTPSVSPVDNFDISDSLSSNIYPLPFNMAVLGKDYKFSCLFAHSNYISKNINIDGIKIEHNIFPSLFYKYYFDNYVSMGHLNQFKSRYHLGYYFNIYFLLRYRNIPINNWLVVQFIYLLHNVIGTMTLYRHNVLERIRSLDSIFPEYTGSFEDAQNIFLKHYGNIMRLIQDIDVISKVSEYNWNWKNHTLYHQFLDRHWENSSDEAHVQIKAKENMEDLYNEFISIINGHIYTVQEGEEL